jgi:hypothetical protein
VRTWHKLERAFLLAFKEKYGSVPYFNTAGKNVEEQDEFNYLAKERVKDILDNLEQSGIAPDRPISRKLSQ